MFIITYLLTASFCADDMRHFEYSRRREYDQHTVDSNATLRLTKINIGEDRVVMAKVKSLLYDIQVSMALVMSAF